MTDLRERLVRAIAQQDEDALRECFAPDAEFRALIPPGLRERNGAIEAAALIAQWFGDSTELRLLAQTVTRLETACTSRIGSRVSRTTSCTSSSSSSTASSRATESYAPIFFARAFVRALPASRC